MTAVLLVDDDIANPRLRTLLSRRGARGLFDALGQETLDAETLVVDTDIPGLSFLPAGTTTHESSELLASHAIICVRETSPRAHWSVKAANSSLFAVRR